MLAAIAVSPSAPVLVPELAGAAAAEVADLRESAVAAAATLPRRWIAIGVDSCDRIIDADARGSFAGYGADVPVTLSSSPGPRVSELPLCALFAGWLRGRANPAAEVQVRTFAAAHDAQSALDRGRALRREIDRSDDAVGVLVVADGATTLTPSAPGGYDPSAEPVQTALDDALATGDLAALHDLPDWIAGRVAYQVLAGLAEPGPGGASELARAAPYGVGYFVGTWLP